MKNQCYQFIRFIIRGGGLFAFAKQVTINVAAKNNGLIANQNGYQKVNTIII